MNRIEEIKNETNEEIKEVIIIKRGRGRPLKIKEIKEEIKDDTIKKKSERKTTAWRQTNKELENER